MCASQVLNERFGRTSERMCCLHLQSKRKISWYKVFQKSFGSVLRISLKCDLAGIVYIFVVMDIQIVFHSTMAPNGIDKALTDPGAWGCESGAPKQQDSKIWFGFFWTGFHSSERKQYSGSESRDTGVTTLQIIGRAPTGYLSKWWHRMAC